MESNFEINRTDDIMHQLDNSSCYNKTVELLKASGAYDDFVRCVNEKVDWSNLFTRMGEMENEAISDAIDSVAREKGVKLEDE